MGIRGELFSTRVNTEGRTYFFNVKENRMGDVFLTIVESKPTETENFDRRSIVLFRDDVKDFLSAFQGALDYMAKPGSAHAEAPSFDAGAMGRSSTKVSHRRERQREGFAGSEAPGATESAAGPGPRAGKGADPAKKRRIVVKRKPGGEAGA